MAGKRKKKDAPDEKDPPRFTIPMPGGKVAKVPVGVLTKYVEPGARSAHASAAVHKSAADGGSKGGSVTINIFTGGSAPKVDVQEVGEDDVVAHSLTVDPATGTSEWHTDWEYGECEYTDESGFPQRIHAWHRHPFGTEYSELYEG